MLWFLILFLSLLALLLLVLFVLFSLSLSWYFRGISAYIQLYTITFIPLSIQLCEFYSNFCDHVWDRLKILHLLLCVSFRNMLWGIWWACVNGCCVVLTDDDLYTPSPPNARSNFYITPRKIFCNFQI